LKAPPRYSPRTSAIHGPNPTERTKPETWHRVVLTNLVRCCSAFAHTPISPSSLDSRCSAFGCALGAPFNGQSIDAGQAAAPIHRIHHSNEHPVGCANIGRVRIPVSAACTVLGVYYLPPSPTRARVINYWRQGADVLTQCPYRPPQAKERGKSVQNSPSTPPGHSDIVAKCQTVFRQIGNYEGFKSPAPRSDVCLSVACCTRWPISTPEPIR
jgi:hypothetical protein